MIEAGAVQENHQRQVRIEGLAARRGENLSAVHSQNHVSSLL